MTIRKSAFVTVAFGMSILLLSTSAAFGQQNKDQQKCINKLNKGGVAVARARGKENAGCLKKAGKNQLSGTAQDCLSEDPKMKVDKKITKTSNDETSFCGVTPDFGYTSAAAVNAAALQAELDLTADIFGTDLGAAVIDCDTDKAGCLCQQKVMKDIQKIAATKLKVFLKCKQAVLKGGATSATALENCVDDAGTAGSIAADSLSKIQKRINKLNADIAGKCAGVSGAFPGDCDTLTGSALGTCLDAQAECRVCQIINEMDDLSVNCDLFDDTQANTTCDSGAGPPPSPTSPPVGGLIFQGALPQTTGRFTFMAMIGIAGADAECSAQFASTHACTHVELQAAEAAGDLAGASDVNSMTVTSFWAIDSTRSDVDQCTVTLPWDYQTAHTGQFADKVTLNNGTGALGPLTAGNICATSSWVGCCL